MGVPVFLSYASADRDLIQALLKFLDPLERRGVIEVWWDRNDLRAGDRFVPEIKEAIRRARLAIVGVSQDFFSSPFITKDEAPLLVDGVAGGRLRLMPLFLRPSPEVGKKWPAQHASGLVLGELHGLNDLQKPLATGNQDVLLTEAVGRLEKVLEELVPSSARPAGTTGRTPGSAPRQTRPADGRCCVRVIAPRATKRVAGTGCLVAPRIVMTSKRLIGTAVEGTVEIRLASGEMAEASLRDVVWRGQDGLDVVLLRLPDAAESIPALLSAEALEGPWDALGFGRSAVGPHAVGAPDVAIAGDASDVPSGGTRISLDVPSQHQPGSPREWAGLAGAPVFRDGAVVAVITKPVASRCCVEVVPVAALLQAPGFANEVAVSAVEGPIRAKLRECLPQSECARRELSAEFEIASEDQLAERLLQDQHALAKLARAFDRWLPTAPRPELATDGQRLLNVAACIVAARLPVYVVTLGDGIRQLSATTPLTAEPQVARDRLRLPMLKSPAEVAGEPVGRDVHLVDQVPETGSTVDQMAIDLIVDVTAPLPTDHPLDRSRPLDDPGNERAVAYFGMRLSQGPAQRYLLETSPRPVDEKRELRQALGMVARSLPSLGVYSLSGDPERLRQELDEFVGPVVGMQDKLRDRLNQRKDGLDHEQR
ncbi:MAG: toll/interleukin-1 receptor domain-containing protein [Planctomycetota bacterium]